MWRAVAFAPAVAEEIVEAESSPVQQEPASATAAVAAQGAVEAATAGSAGLPLTTLQEREEAAPSEFGGESIMFSEAGDSIAASDGGDAAVATGAPHAQRVERHTSPIYRTHLTHERFEYWQQSQRIQGERQGNIGFMFGNWGRMPARPVERERVLMQLKRQPAQIVCLAEAEELVETTLRSPPSTRGAESAVADALDQRESFEHPVIRGREHCSILMAVRATVARSLECLHWERRFEGANQKRKH